MLKEEHDHQCPNCGESVECEEDCNLDEFEDIPCQDCMDDALEEIEEDAF